MTIVFTKEDMQDVAFPVHKSGPVVGTPDHPVWMTFDGEWIQDSGEW
jgi:hypothetical protein